MTVAFAVAIIIGPIVRLTRNLKIIFKLREYEISEEVDEIKLLEMLALQSRCPQIHLTFLLKILLKRLLPQLPACAKIIH